MSKLVLLGESHLRRADVDARRHFAASAAHRVPTPVVGVDHVAGLTADGAYSHDGWLWRWDSDGVPKRVDITGAQEIATRDGALCARLDDGRVLCTDPSRCGPPPAPRTPPPPPAHPPARAGKPKPGARPTKPAPAPPPPVGEPAIAFAVPAARQLAFTVSFCVVTHGRLQSGDGCRKPEPVYLERVERLAGRCAILKSGTVACSDGAKFDAIDGIVRALRSPRAASTAAPSPTTPSAAGRQTPTASSAVTPSAR